MNITRLAIENNRITLVLLVLIFFAGFQTFNQMPRAYDPGFIVRTAQVLTYFPGASPQRVEQLVSAQIEEAVKEIPELDFVKSESRTGVSIVLVNIKAAYKDMRPIWDNLRRKIEDKVPDLPDNIGGPFINDEFGDVYGIVLTITGEGFDNARLQDVADEVKDTLQQIPDAAKIDILGAQEERIFVEYDNARLSELGISPHQLAQMLEARNIVISGGAFNLGNERIALEPTGNFESVEDIGKTVITSPQSKRLVMLRDIAHISRGYVDPPSTLVHSSGQRALAVAVSMREGGNNIVLGEQVLAAVNRLEQRFPHGIEFDLVNFSPAEVDAKVKDFMSNLLQAIAVVTLVMLVSLGMRTGLVVAMLIPTTMLLSLIVMSLFDIGLDQISLAALIIALGMLVDNGIVMSESIMVQMEKGTKALDAAIASANELKVPLLTASLTTSAAFLPIYLAESDVGEFTASLFKVVTITLLCSWVISLTIIPLLCVKFLKITPSGEELNKPAYEYYRNLLSWMLRHKAVTLLITSAVFAVAISGLSLLPKIFFPPSDRSYFKMELELPTAYTIEGTEAVVDAVEGFLADELQVNEARPEGITNWVSYVGDAGPRFLLSHNPKPSSSNYALIVANVSDVSAIPNAMAKIRQYAQDHHPDLTLKLKLIENGPSVENPVEVRLSGLDSDLLFFAVEELRGHLRQMPQLQNVTDDWGQRIKKLRIDIDQVRAQRAGVTSQDIAISLQSGLTGMELTEYREEEDSIPVLLRTEASGRQTLSKVESLSVYAQSSGHAVPLSQVASVEMVWDIAKVYRRNGIRTVTLGAQLVGDANAAAVVSQLDGWLQEQLPRWQNRVSYSFGGEQESSAKANQSIADKLSIAGMIILVLLVAQFNSVRKSLIVLSTIPLGLIGVVIGLLVARSYFGFMTILGIVSLAGIVINNAIVLLERIQIELDAGVAHFEAIISAALQRARPILLTTATTVLGLIPLYLGGGAMWEPMAIAIMAGLLFSTVLTLGVIPVLYAWLYGVKAKTS
ncbi:efflux RND transporter permease subunit [Aliiglaciecola sp. CAU 1673]|uniref:efflux RND transporter permease subunit n=1 Tax=Aliiglaciecola sp. CAU 1673 TaxID=3032595 RepID=UPI0023DAEDD2|nr:efflux RND transporter permease subunit [Aliiglaciecola sp. CAU 1673]MDF2178338.1 efflux RND transporter permease subunit [Aliiglaciecola sp. CAU 1673]